MKPTLELRRRTVQIVCLLSLVFSVANGPSAAAAEKIRALLITGGCCHDYGNQKHIITEGTSRRAAIAWTVVHEGGTSLDHEVSIYNTPRWAEGYDVVVHNECFANTKDFEFVQKILAEHQRGVPAVAIHCSMHCYRTPQDKAAGWHAFLGVSSWSHEGHRPFTVKLLDAKHPIMKDFPASWDTPNGELYKIDRVYPTARPLAKAWGADTQKDHVVAWTNHYGDKKTRVFGTTIGHHNATMKSPEWLGMVTRGILWAAGKLDDDGNLGDDGKPAEGVGASISQGESVDQSAIATFKVPTEVRVELWSEQHMLSNPLAIDLDERGRLYVAEIGRLRAGVDSPPDLHEDLASMTVEDRLAMYKRHPHDRPEGDLGWYRSGTDRIKILEDTSGDGRADRAVVFADGFNDPLDGLGAGVIVRNGTVWYTNIPNLWRLRDIDGDDVADTRDSLAYGFGIRVGYVGHDLHGLVWGPDGKLYFSIGDRGYNVVTQEGNRLTAPGRGAVFRCYPDGRELEVYHRGLRNPQELAFDDFGNLFAGDNNADGGDRARLVYCMEDADSGWNQGYQYRDRRGPWIGERMCEPQNDAQPAFMVPPVANVASGPCGFSNYPGLGLPAKYKGYFFLCDYRYNPANTGILSFAVKQRGAGFEMVDLHEFFWHVVATDMAFGYDGKMYVSDYLGGDDSKKGRVYTVFSPEAVSLPAVKEMTTIFADGIEKLGDRRLLDLLAHDDRRVRLRAQFALAERGDAQADALANVALNSESRLARLHAIWALGQLAATDPAVLETVLPLLQDDDEEVRAQAAKVCGDAGLQSAGRKLTDMLSDRSSRVRAQAAIAVGKLGHDGAIPMLLDTLRNNRQRDPWLRSACVSGLSGFPGDALAAQAGNRSAAVRLGLLLALRKQGDARVTLFLNDADRHVVKACARAIHDAEIDAALPALAAALEPSNVSRDDQSAPESPKPAGANWHLRRLINANLRLGRAADALRVARFAANRSNDPDSRSVALAALGEWSAPDPLDKIVGYYRHRPKRDRAIAAAAVGEVIGSLLRDPSGSIQAEALKLATSYGLTLEPEVLLPLVANEAAELAPRREALRFVVRSGSNHARAAVDSALISSRAELRSDAVSHLGTLDPAAAIEQIATTLREGGMPAKQAALVTLAGLDSAAAIQLTRAWLARFDSGSVSAELELELLQVARALSAGDPQISSRLQAVETSLAQRSLGRRSIARAGGDAARGRELFFNHPTAQCSRCHRAGGQTGSDVGPDLTGIAAQRDRAYLLESLLDPNAKIAKGFETVVLQLDDGTIQQGIVRGETDTELTIDLPLDLATASTAPDKAKQITLQKSDIEQRRQGISSMPAGLAKSLTDRQLRDLMEFIATNTRD